MGNPTSLLGIHTPAVRADHVFLQFSGVCLDTLFQRRTPDSMGRGKQALLDGQVWQPVSTAQRSEAKFKNILLLLVNSIRDELSLSLIDPSIIWM